MTQPETSLHATYDSKPNQNECPAPLCYRGKHKRSVWLYRNGNCNACGRKGHIANVCRNKDNDWENSPGWNWKTGRTHQITTPETTSIKSETAIFDNWFLLWQCPNNPFTVILMNHVKTVNLHWGRARTTWTAYSPGCVWTTTLPLLAVDGSGPSLLAHDWLASIKLDWHSFNRVETEVTPPTNTLQDVMQWHADVFKKELGTVKGIYAKLWP